MHLRQARLNELEMTWVVVHPIASPTSTSSELEDRRMAETMGRDQYEELQETLDPHRKEERDATSAKIAAQLPKRGVHLVGKETSEELVALLEAVERFEEIVVARGGDLFVSEGPEGRPRESVNPDFVLPERAPNENVASYVVRIDEATRRLM